MCCSCMYFQRGYTSSASGDPDDAPSPVVPRVVIPKTSPSQRFYSTTITTWFRVLCLDLHKDTATLPQHPLLDYVFRTGSGQAEGFRVPFTPTGPSRIISPVKDQRLVSSRVVKYGFTERFRAWHRATNPCHLSIQMAVLTPREATSRRFGPSSRSLWSNMASIISTTVGGWWVGALRSVGQACMPW